MNLWSWVLCRGGSQQLPSGRLGSGLGRSRSLTPRSHDGSAQVSMSTMATYCSLVTLSALMLLLLCG